jgi:hypothetical protein
MNSNSRAAEPNKEYINGVNWSILLLGPGFDSRLRDYPCSRRYSRHRKPGRGCFISKLSVTVIISVHAVTLQMRKHQQVTWQA